MPRRPPSAPLPTAQPNISSPATSFSASTTRNQENTCSLFGVNHTHTSAWLILFSSHSARNHLHSSPALPYPIAAFYDENNSFNIAPMLSFRYIRRVGLIVITLKFIHEASTGLHPWYPSFLLRRNPPKHPPSLFELRRVRHAHSSTDLRPWSSAKADKQ